MLQRNPMILVVFWGETLTNPKLLLGGGNVSHNSGRPLGEDGIVGSGGRT